MKQPPYARRRAIAGALLTVLTVSGFYLLPILAWTVCAHLGWYVA